MKISPPLTLIQASEILSCKFKGFPDHPITGINEIHRVEAGDLTFVDVEKYYQKALESKADTVIINKDVEVPEGKGLLITEDPFTAYNLLTEHFQPAISWAEDKHSYGDHGVKISPKATIGTDVMIGEGSEIGHGAVIGSHVRMGRNCRIHPNVTIYPYTEIGDEVTINAGTVIGSEAFYFKSRPDRKDKMVSKGRVLIGSHVDIGANCTIDRGVSADTMIGEWTKIDNLVQIGHDSIVGKRCLIASQVGIAGVVELEDDVILWGQVGVNKDLKIGKGAQLYGKTGVMSDLEGGKTYLGMVADDARQKLREIAAVKKLPDLIRRWERFFRDKDK